MARKERSRSRQPPDRFKIGERATSAGGSPRDGAGHVIDEDVPIRPAVAVLALVSLRHNVATSEALERDRAVINQIAVRFTDAAGVAPNIASVIMGYTIPRAPA